MWTKGVPLITKIAKCFSTTILFHSGNHSLNECVHALWIFLPFFPQIYEQLCNSCEAFQITTAF